MASVADAVGAVGLLLLAAAVALILYRKAINEKWFVGVFTRKRRVSDAKTSDVAAKHLTVVFGTQSGTAQNFSEELGREAKSYGFAAKVVDIENYDPDQMMFEEFVVFLVATYGEGDPTDAALSFMEWITSKDRSSSEIEGIPFAVFGLGNKQYENFNAQGKLLDKRLEELGGLRIVDRGDGDDDGSMEKDWSHWKAKFWPAVVTHFGGSLDDVVEMAFEPSFRIVYSADEKTEPLASLLKRGHAGAGSQTKESEVVSALVTVNRELRKIDHASGFIESTRHIEIDVGPSRISYQTADNLGVLACNNPQRVALLAKKQGYDLNKVFVMKALDPKSMKKPPITEAMTVRDALMWKVDISSPPRRQLLGLLSGFAQDENEKSTLRDWSKESSSEAITDDYIQLFKIECHDFAYLFERFPSIQIPLENLLELLPKLQPRFYTIASSSLVHPQSVHITVSVIQSRTPGGRTFSGLCSNFLATTVAGKSMIPVFIRESTFRLPKCLATPVVMIGPGTGIAPMRAFLQESAFLRSKGESLSAWWLYFGCRYKDVDYIYKEEMETALENRILSKLRLAFSREQKEKVYVQHKLTEDFEELYPLVNEHDAHIYVCGATSMGKDIREAFIAMLQEKGGMSKDEASSKLHEMQSSGKFVSELWG